MYFVFRWILAQSDFAKALKTIIWISIVQAVLMCITTLTPLRLIIPIVLYSIASYQYHRLVKSEIVDENESDQMKPEYRLNERE